MVMTSKMGFARVEDFLNESWKSLSCEYKVDDENPTTLFDFIGSLIVNGDFEGHSHSNFSGKQNFIDGVRSDAARILEILHQDGPGFNVKANLSDLGIRVSGLLVREVLYGILKMINYINRNRCAKMGYKFFVWSGEQEDYGHTTNAYYLIMKIFAESEEYKAMWRLVDEMVEKGYPTTAHTFNILICTFGEAGLARKVVERFIKSKTFNHRPFKNSFNAILHALPTVNQYKLVEWVYQQMLVEGHSPDMLTYNIIMSAKFRLGS